MPTAPTGDTTSSDVFDTMLKAAGTPSKYTPRVPARLVPVIVRLVPPVLGPLVWLSDVIVGVVVEVVV